MSLPYSRLRPDLFNKWVNRAIVASSTVGVLTIGFYLLRYRGAAGQAKSATALDFPRSLMFTALFLAIGTYTIARAQPDFVGLCGRLPVRCKRVWPGHAGFVALGVILTLPFVVGSARSLDSSGAFPMPTAVATAAFVVIAMAVVALCWHGIYSGCCFLLYAYTYSHEPAGSQALLTYANGAEQATFDRVHAYTAWAFSVSGMLQLPILLALRPGLPSVARAIALAFTIALFVLGPLIFWLPRHWLRQKLGEEATQLVGHVAAGGSVEKLEMLPAYEFLIARLQNRGLALSIPAITMAITLKLKDIVELAKAVGLKP